MRGYKPGRVELLSIVHCGLVHHSVLFVQAEQQSVQARAILWSGADVLQKGSSIAHSARWNVDHHPLDILARYDVAIGVLTAGIGCGDMVQIRKDEGVENLYRLVQLRESYQFLVTQIQF